MIKKYTLGLTLLFIVLTQVLNKAYGQYAIGGTAGTSLVNSVYWLTWDKGATGSTLISSPAGSDAFNIINGTYVWQFSPTVRITAVISNEVTSNGAFMQAYTPGNYSADGLDLIYSGNNLPKPNSRGVSNSALATPYGQTVTFDIDVKVAILINNVYTDIVYPGMVIGDAESIDSGGEYISGDTPNPIAWQLLNKRTQGNAADNHYKMDLSNSGKSFKLYVDLSPGNFGVQAVMFAHNARNLKNVSMKGSGIQALAVGFVLPFDLGDDPSTYGTTGHYMENFLITDYYTGDGTFTVVNYNTTPLVAQAPVYIGTNNVDPDGQPVSGANANSDDLTGNNDESTITPSALPDIKVNQAGNVVLSIPATNTKGVPATLYAWIDFNNDGIFSSTELVSVTVPANTNNQTFTLTFPNSMFVGKIKVGSLYMRMRITTTTLVDDISTAVDERSVSFAADGEAEDYRLKDILGVNISGTIFNDGNGGLDNTIAGTGVQFLSGTQLYAYLVDNTGTIVDKTVVGSGGIYSFANENNGTYTVAISTNNVAVGGALSAVAANLPANWRASGASYGTNNAANSGIQTGTPNLQIQVATPGTSLDVTNLNFGVNQIPVTVADAGTTNINTPVTLNVPANDSDVDGTLDLTKVLLIDPADNGKKTSVTISGQGTYTVNTTTGVVTFTPIATFVGKTVPLAYTIKDNYGSESASALITINVKPVGVNDNDVTPINTPVITTVKANDGASGTSTTVTPTAGLHGTTTVDATGKVTYTPAAGFVGTDTYTYTLTTADGVVSAPITVTILVKPIGVADAVTTPINTPVITTVTANDGPSGVGATVTPANGTHGTTSVDATGKVTYTPAAGYIGKDTYTYTLTNGGVVSDPITVSVNIKPVGVNDVDATPVNIPVTTTVKANDGPSGVGTTVISTNGAHGITSVDGTGKVIYTPVAGYVGTDTYTYTLTTADGVVSDPITVTITITNTIAGVPDAVTTPINTPVTTTVTANDGPGAIGATVTPTNGSHGTTSVDATGKVTYTPVAGYIGKDTYTYVLTNGASTSAPITVTVSIKPVGVNDVDATPVNTPVTTTVKANDGPSGIGTTVTPTNGAHGITTVDAAGKVTYTPVSGYVGTDTYTYTLTTADGVVSDPITVTITISNAITGVPDAVTTPINTPVTTTVTANDGTGAIGATVTATNGAHGTTTVDATGKVTYTPAAGYVGKDTYTYTLTNGASVSAPITVTVSIKPVGAPDADATLVNNPVTTNVKLNDGPSGTNSTVTPTNGAHGTTTVDATGKVTYTPTPGYTGTDTYTYTLTTADGVVSDPITVTITIYPPGALSLTKVANNTVNKVGDVITYTLVVTNSGSTALTNVSITDAGADAGSILPATVPSLAIGASVTATAKHTVTQADVTAGSYSNQANALGVDPFGRPVTAKSDNPATIAANDATVVTIISPPGPAAFHIPSLFSPNGDGINDVFEIRGLSQFFENDLTIVNRWGNEVYKQSNYQNNWTGEGLTDGTYYYILKLKKTATADWVVYKGYITLLRTFTK